MQGGSDTHIERGRPRRKHGFAHPEQFLFIRFGNCRAGTGICTAQSRRVVCVDPASPNALAGHKRPLHTIIPGFAQKAMWHGVWIMGGWNQSQAHAQFIANLADFKMNIQSAVEAPRFVNTRSRM